MMKAIKISAILSVIILLTICAAAPTVSAASADAQGDTVLDRKVSAYSGEYKANQPFTYWNSNITVYGPDDYEKYVDAFRNHTEYPDSQYEPNKEIPAGHYWLVSNYTNSTDVNLKNGGTDFIMLNSLGTWYPLSMSYFMVSGNGSPIDIHLSDHTGDVIVVIVDSVGKSSLDRNDIERYIDKTISALYLKVLKNGENDLSVSCTYEKTDQYYLVLAHYSSSAVETPEAIHYSVKVDGVSSTSDSAGLSYAIIGISLALLVGLLIIANRKIMP